MPGQCLEGTAHAKVHPQDHCLGACPKEIEHVLAVNFNAGQNLHVECLSACNIHRLLSARALPDTETEWNAI